AARRPRRLIFFLFSTGPGLNGAWKGKALWRGRAMPVDSKRVQTVFLAVVEADDPAALDRECGADAPPRQRVEAVLRAHDAPASLLDGPAFDQVAAGLFLPDEDTSALEGNPAGAQLGAGPAPQHDLLETQDEQRTAAGDRPALDFLQPST